MSYMQPTDQKQAKRQAKRQARNRKRKSTQKAQRKQKAVSKKGQKTDPTNGRALALAASAKGGSVSKLTFEVARTICEALVLSGRHTISAQAAGVSYDSFNLWYNNGERDDKANIHSDFYHFYHAIKKAKNDHAMRHIARIEQASQKGTWFASAWMLERVHPEDYGRKDTSKPTIENKGVIINHVTIYGNNDRLAAYIDHNGAE